ncbi:MAG: glycosyltransferase family 1 protein [Crocinitomicaceae bacterium]
MKKIGILAFWNKYGGGVYQYTQSIVDALKTDDSHQYIVFCFDDDTRFDDYGLEVRKIKEFGSSGLNKVIRFLQFYFYIQKPWGIPKEDLDQFEDIDLFFSPCISEYPHFYLKKDFVFTLHDMQEKYYPHFFSRYIRFTRWLYNRTLTKKAKAIICESEFVKRDIVQFTKTKTEKIHIIPSPPPADFLNLKLENSEALKVKEKYNLPDQYIFYPAQCWEHKNHLKLVEAFKICQKKHPEVHLVLTGSQKDNYPNLVHKIQFENLENKIHHLGYIDYNDFPYLYTSSLFLVMPTLFESLSIPIYEAFALGVPVCSSNVVALPEQVGDAGLLFDPHNSENMAARMIEYLDNPSLRDLMGSKGKQRVLDFNHQNYKSQLIQIIN